MPTTISKKQPSMTDKETLRVLDALGLLEYQPQGANVKIQCPFHETTRDTKTLVIGIATGIWSCKFPGCNAKGPTVIDFVRKVRGCSGMEAMLFVAGAGRGEITRDTAPAPIDPPTPVVLAAPPSQKKSATSRSRRKRSTAPQTPPAKPSFTLGNLKPKNIPAELIAIDQWVMWKYELNKRGDDWTKPPYNPHAARAKAKPNDPSTAGPFLLALQRAQERAMDGIGSIFTDELPYVGVDLDDCRDPVTGELSLLAARVVKGLNSYAEVSPSGKGIKIIVRGTIPSGDREFKTAKGKVEIYDGLRYFTFTGHHIAGTPKTIEQRDSQINRFYAAVSRAAIRGEEHTGTG